MNGSTGITGVAFTAASPVDRASGLLGFAAFDVGPVRIDSVAVRRTRAGRLELSYPVRARANGGRYAIVRPLDTQARRAIEAQVLDALAPELAALEREERAARRAGGSR